MKPNKATSRFDEQRKRDIRRNLLQLAIFFWSLAAAIIAIAIAVLR